MIRIYSRVGLLDKCVVVVEQSRVQQVVCCWYNAVGTSRWSLSVTALSTLCSALQTLHSTLHSLLTLSTLYFIAHQLVESCVLCMFSEYQLYTLVYCRLHYRWPVSVQSPVSPHRSVGWLVSRPLGPRSVSQSVGQSPGLSVGQLVSGLSVSQLLRLSVGRLVPGLLVSQLFRLQSVSSSLPVPGLWSVHNV